MSSELLTGEAYHFSKSSKSLSTFKLSAATKKHKPRSSPTVAIKHDIVHDLESFFWVLCWLCVSYEGPSTRRTQAWDEDETLTTNLKQAIRKTFESPDAVVLASQKTALLIHSDPDDSKLDTWCTPYFHPLLPLVTGLHATLKEAYGTRTFTGLHRQFLEQFAFAETMEDVPTCNGIHPTYRSLEEHEAATRQREREGPLTDDASPKVGKSKEEIQGDVDARHREFGRVLTKQNPGNTTPDKGARSSSFGSSQKRAVRFDGYDAAEDTPAASSSSPFRKASKRQRKADDDAVEGNGAHASSSTSATGEASSIGPRRSTRSKTKAVPDARTTAATGSRPAKETKTRSKKVDHIAK